MTSLTVYDPAMCCNTGVCGPEVDPKLVQFAGDLEWLKTSGIAVTRINLSQEPAAFAANEQVKSVLESAGVEGLPVVLVGDKLQTSGLYPARGELAKMVGIDYVADAEPAAAKADCCGGAEPKSGCC